jgi:small subunit ribosomal protein S17
MSETTAQNESQSPRKPLVGLSRGTVTSDKRDQTVKVEINFLAKDPKYGKYVKRRSVLHVHDPKNEAKTGDVVDVAPCRRLSKTKAYRLVKVVEVSADRAHD